MAANLPSTYSALQAFSPSSSWSRPDLYVIRKNITAYLASHDGKSLLCTDNNAEYALNDHDMEAIAILRRANSFTIFGLFLSVNPMTTMPVSPHLNSVSDTKARVMLSILLIATDYFT